MLRRGARALAGVLLLTACSGLPDTVAVVDGVRVAGDRLSEMSPTNDPDPSERIEDLNLLIIHEILTARAESEFGFVASGSQIEEAFDERVRGREEDLEEWLAARGSTPERAMLEAELDVIRNRLEDVMVESEDYGFDFDEAYRTFIGVNSRVCMEGLLIADQERADAIESAVERGSDLDTLASEFPGVVEATEIGCNIPIEFGPLLSPVAVDGEIGVAYLRETEDGTRYVVQVTERDAPDPGDVREEVIDLGRERQGPGLFNAWVIEQLKASEVEVDESVGVWATTEEGDIPTVAMAPDV